LRCRAHFLQEAAIDVEGGTAGASAAKGPDLGSVAIFFSRPLVLADMSCVSALVLEKCSWSARQ
jgi:hypothetical protein